MNLSFNGHVSTVTYLKIAFVNVDQKYLWNKILEG